MKIAPDATLRAVMSHGVNSQLMAAATVATKAVAAAAAVVVVTAGATDVVAEAVALSAQLRGHANVLTRKADRSQPTSAPTARRRT